MPRTHAGLFVSAGLLIAVLIFATSRPAPSAAATREVHAFFAAVAEGRLETACARLAPSARRPLAAHGGCVRELRGLRGAWMGAPGASASLTPAAFLSRLDSATAVQAQSLSADGSVAHVLVPPCIGVFVVKRASHRPWRIARVPFA